MGTLLPSVRYQTHAPEALDGDGHTLPTAPQQQPPLGLRLTAPNAVNLPVLERILEALLPDPADGTHEHRIPDPATALRVPDLRAA